MNNSNDTQNEATNNVAAPKIEDLNALDVIISESHHIFIAKPRSACSSPAIAAEISSKIKKTRQI